MAAEARRWREAAAESWDKARATGAHGIDTVKRFGSETRGQARSAKDKIAFEHPAIFPEQLALDQISTWTNEGDLVYDCFMGSGTTAKAAIEIGRGWVGTEISEDYVQIAEERLRPYILKGQLAGAR